jgi:hypothetical protein
MNRPLFFAGEVCPVQFKQRQALYHIFSSRKTFCPKEFTAKTQRFLDNDFADYTGNFAVEKGRVWVVL